MDALGAILAAVTIFGTLYGIASSVDQSQKADEYNDKSLDLAKKNIDLNQENAQQNFDLQKQQFDYQKQLNETLMQREDTAIQRQVADLKAAGLSPLMAAGGASASPLTSANAPQFDMSGINTAMGNMIGAYNDAFNRKNQVRNFALQNRVQTAQAFTQLAETYRDQKAAQLEYKYLEKKLAWEELHGFRDIDWKSDLTKLIEDVLNGRGNSVIPDLPGLPSREDVADSVNKVLDSAAYSSEENWSEFGSVSRHTKYGHTLDNENYDNNRSTIKLLKEEAIEKKNKVALKIRDTIDNRIKLYNSDDYLKKHISEENWKKMPKSFIDYYLKYGEFEGHKKYFE